MAKVKFTTTIEEELLKQVKKLAIDEGCSVSDILEKLLRELLERADE